MRRRFEQCRKCPSFKAIFWMEGVWMYKCNANVEFVNGMEAVEVSCPGENRWNLKEIPKKCVYYVERFVEDCNIAEHFMEDVYDEEKN